MILDACRLAGGMDIFRCIDRIRMGRIHTEVCVRQQFYHFGRFQPTTVDCNAGHFALLFGTQRCRHADDDLGT